MEGRVKDGAAAGRASAQEALCYPGAETETRTGTFSTKASNRSQCCPSREDAKERTCEGARTHTHAHTCAEPTLEEKKRKRRPC